MPEKLCECGCGLPAERNKRVKRGHLKNLLPSHCACGCGQELEHKSASSGYIAKYVQGHNDAYADRSTDERRRILAPNLEKATRRRMELMNDTEWKKFDSERKRIGHLNRWATASEGERRQHGQRSIGGMSEEGRQRWLLGYTMRRAGEHHAQKMRAAWARLRKNPKRYKERCRNISLGVSQAWKDGKLDDSGTKTWFHHLASGRKVLVQSTWEAACADALESMNISFKRGGRVVLETRSWRPDFLVSYGDACFYLEVKGHPLARAQFEKVQLPRIHYSPLPVAILNRRPPYPTDIDGFLGQLDWLHY